MKTFNITLLLLLLWSFGNSTSTELIKTWACSVNDGEAIEGSIYNPVTGEVGSMMTCNFYVGVPSGYISGNQNGEEVLILPVTTSPSFGSAASYRWTVTYTNGGNYTTATTNNTTSPPIPASTSNQISSVSVRVVHQGCVQYGSRNYWSPIPQGGGGFGG